MKGILCVLLEYGEPAALSRVKRELPRTDDICPVLENPKDIFIEVH